MHCMGHVITQRQSPRCLYLTIWDRANTTTSDMSPCVFQYFIVYVYTCIKAWGGIYLMFFNTLFSTFSLSYYFSPFGSLNLNLFPSKLNPMLIPQIPLLCCLKSLYVRCFKAHFIDMLSNTRQLINIILGLHNVTKYVNKGFQNIAMTKNWDTKQWEGYNMMNTLPYM